MKEKLLNRHKAFLELTRPEILNKIDISKELIPSFINVMNRFQKVFEKKGLMNATNFAMLFEKTLIGEEDLKFSIKIEDLEKVYGKTNAGNAGGLYDFQKRAIYISKKGFEEYIKDHPTVVESIIAHEFIHFLALTELPWIETENGTFVQKEGYFQEHFGHPMSGTFVGEGFTQLLTEVLYPNNLAYYPYTSMMKMYLTAFSTEDYVSFLRGRLPGKTYFSEKVTKFMTSAERLFAYNFKNKMDWEQEILHPYYKETFNILIEAFKEKVSLEIERFEFATAEEFAERIYNFKKSSIIKSQYLDDSLNELITDFASKYYKKQDILKQYEIKQNIEHIIKYDMQYLSEPNLGGIYKIPSKNDGYYCMVKNFDNHIMLESFNPDGVLLRKDKIGKIEGLEAGFDFGTKTQAVDFYIKNNTFHLSVYDKSWTELPDEEYLKIPQDERPQLYTVPLINPEVDEKISEKNKNARNILSEMSEIITNQDLALMNIVRENKDIMSILNVEGIFEGTNNALYIATGRNKNDFKFFYVSGKYHKEIKKLDGNIIKLPVSNAKDMYVSVEINDIYIDVISFDKRGKNEKVHNMKYLYHTSKSYHQNIKEREEYQEYAAYNFEN